MRRTPGPSGPPAPVASSPLRAGAARSEGDPAREVADLAREGTASSWGLSRRDIGTLGEGAAASFLVARGMAVLGRNWRGRDGEIDIVALAPGDTLVIVEVKTRTGTGFGMPALAVTASKYARLRRLAAQWVAAHGYRPAAIRIDVVGVLASRRGEIFDIDHIEGAFR